MPEGDSVWKAARRLREQLVGRTVVRSDFRVPRHATADLSGRRVTTFDAYGKHMLTRFSPGSGDDGITLHTHFEMDGAWQVVGPGLSPWTPVSGVDLAATVQLARRMMRHSLEHPGQVTTGDTRRGRTHWVYGRAGRPCRRCGTPVAFRDSVTGTPYSRETWWCPSCQPGRFPSLAERPTRPGLRRGVNEESFGSRTARMSGRPGYSRGSRA